MATLYPAAAHGRLREVAGDTIVWSSQPVLVSIWAKRFTRTETLVHCYIGNGNGQATTNVAMVGVRVLSSGDIQAIAFDGTFRSLSLGTLSDSDWHHYAAFVDPFDGTSGTFAGWFDGAKTSSALTFGTVGSTTLNRFVASDDSFSSEVDEITLAHGGYWFPADETEADSIVAELQTLAPTATTVAAQDAWNLIADLNSDAAGDNLENTGGTAPTFDADDPLAAVSSLRAVVSQFVGA